MRGAHPGGITKREDQRLEHLVKSATRCSEFCGYGTSHQYLVVLVRLLWHHLGKQARSVVYNAFFDEQVDYTQPQPIREQRPKETP